MGGLRQSKEQMALLFVKQKCDLLEPGGALPGIYLLMKESGLGRWVLEKAVAKLRDEGYLEVRSRQGAFRTDKDNFTGSREIVDILFYISGVGAFRPTSFMGEMIQTFDELAAQRHLNIRLHQIEYDKPLENVMELVRRYRILQCFLISPLGRHITAALKTMVPRIVEVIPRYLDVYGPAVVDNPDMATMQMNYLHMLGHRRIAYIHNISVYKDAALVQHKRLTDYYRFMAEHTLQVNPDWVFQMETDRTLFFRQVNRMLKSAPMPTAVVVADPALMWLYDYCRIHQIKIGSELSIMGSDGLKSLNLTPSVTSVINSPTLIARAAWDIMDDLRAGSDARKIITNKLEIRTGASAKRIPAESAM